MVQKTEEFINKAKNYVSIKAKKVLHARLINRTNLLNFNKGKIIIKRVLFFFLSKLK